MDAAGKIQPCWPYSVYSAHPGRTYGMAVALTFTLAVELLAVAVEEGASNLKNTFL